MVAALDQLRQPAKELMELDVKIRALNVELKALKDQRGRLAVMVEEILKAAGTKSYEPMDENGRRLGKVRIHQRWYCKLPADLDPVQIFLRCPATADFVKTSVHRGQLNAFASRCVNDDGQIELPPELQGIGVEIRPLFEVRSETDND